MSDSIYKLKKTLVDFVGNTKIYPSPGFILFGEASYKVKGPLMRKILNEIQPGDILIRMYSHYIGSYFIPGYWTHAAHYEGPNNVIHMLGEGIVEEDILTFLRCDDVALLRSKKGTESVQAAIKEARFLLDKSNNDPNYKIRYDYDFKSGNTNFYCTEFVAHIHKLNYPKDKMIMPDKFPKDPDLEIIIPGRREGSI